MYWLDIYKFNNSIEYEFKYPGNYGAKGEKRLPKKKASPEAIKKQNLINKINKSRRIIKANFSPGDPWICNKYPAGTRIPFEEFEKDRKKFYRLLRTEYRKRGRELKYYGTSHIGAHGGLHFHCVVNRITDYDLIVCKVWDKVLNESYASKGKKINAAGLNDFKPIKEAGGYEGLAKYLCTPPCEDDDPEEYEQLTLFPKEEQKLLYSVHCSKNLVRPKPDRKKRSKWTVRNLVENGPKPTPGYYIDRDSIVCGENPYTGYTYYKYIEVKIDSGGGSG